jgi:Tetratricopeptide repeat
MKNPVKNAPKFIARAFAASAAAFATAFTIAAALSIPAHATGLWVDSPYESVVIPLSSHSLAITRAQSYVDEGRTDRAIKALVKIVQRYPTSEAGHRMLAEAYSKKGERTLAERHIMLAQSLTAIVN